jgi:hypothetical protein
MPGVVTMTYLPAHNRSGDANTNTVISGSWSRDGGMPENPLRSWGDTPRQHQQHPNSAAAVDQGFAVTVDGSTPMRLPSTLVSPSAIWSYSDPLTLAPPAQPLTGGTAADVLDLVFAHRPAGIRNPNDSLHDAVGDPNRSGGLPSGTPQRIQSGYFGVVTQSDGSQPPPPPSAALQGHDETSNDNYAPRHQRRRHSDLPIDSLPQRRTLRIPSHSWSAHPPTSSSSSSTSSSQ